MITANKAYQIVTTNHPNEYVHAMNEHESYYSFILLNKGEKIENVTFIFWVTIIDKRTGSMKKVGMDELDDDYKRIDISNFKGEP